MPDHRAICLFQKTKLIIFMLKLDSGLVCGVDTLSSAKLPIINYYLPIIAQYICDGEDLYYYYTKL